MTTMVAFGMSDHADGSVAVGGGCGREHAVQLSEEGHPYVECKDCAPLLVGKVYGWAATPMGVPSTPDELGQREMAERDGVATSRIVLKSVTDALVQAAQGVSATPAAPPLSLTEQLRALPAADRAALLAELDDGKEEKDSGTGKVTAGSHRAAGKTGGKDG